MFTEFYLTIKRLFSSKMSAIYSKLYVKSKRTKTKLCETKTNFITIIIFVLSFIKQNLVLKLLKNLNKYVKN